MRDENTPIVEFQNKICIIRLRGEVTTFSESAIKKEYQAAFAKMCTAIIIDFKEVQYINSAGIAILIGLVTESKANNIPLYISSLIPHFQKIFKMVGLSQYFAERFPDLESGLASLGARS